MNVVDRRVTVATRVDAAGVGWITAHPGERGDGLATQQEILDALAELIADPAVRTIIIAGQPLAVLNGSHSCDASPEEVAVGMRFRQLSEQLWNSSKTLIIRRHEGVASATLPDAPAYTEPLTERELQVVAMACQGASARQMGDRLFISERTVESHVSNAYRKLGIRSRIELVRRAAYFGF